MPYSKTKCCVFTSKGRAAIAVIVVVGDAVIESIGANFRAAGRQSLGAGQVRYGQWIGPQNTGSNESTGQRGADQVGESVVVVPIGHRRIEIHCHGGNAAIERIVEDLQKMGVEYDERLLHAPVSAGEPQVIPEGWLDPWLEHSDPLIHDATDVLSRCSTVQTAAIAMSQVRGALRTWRDESIRHLQETLSTSAAEQIALQARRILAFSPITTRLDRPFDVVLVGPPNVGKSSLINALVGFDRSITMNLPGTTRDVLDAETVLSGWPLRLRDTAGLHVGGDSIEKEGIIRAQRAAQEADLVVFVRQHDAQHCPSAESRSLNLPERTPLLDVVNKADLMDESERGALTGDEILTVATEGQGVKMLADRIVDALVGELPPTGAALVLTPSQAQWVQGIADLSNQPVAMMECLAAHGAGAN